MLKATNIHKTFFQGVDNHVIKGIDLTINKEEFIVITGKSGSGKSTLLYLLSGLEEPSSGTVTFKGRDLFTLNDNEMSALRRKSFGFVFQFYNLVPSLNVRDNILLPLEIDNKISFKEEKRIMDYANLVGIKDKLFSYPFQLSGGEQQRVAIVRALAINPDIIFADEPTGNLDSNSREDVLKVFADLQMTFGKTVVMVTHDESVGKRFATREIYIENGEIVC